MGLDPSIPLGVRPVNLADLATTYFAAKKAKEDSETVKFNRQQEGIRTGFAKNEDTRAANRETRQQGAYDEEFKDLKLKRENSLRAAMTSILGEEAEILSGLAPEKRGYYYKQHALPMLAKHGIDVSDMPEYDDKLIDSWRQMAMSPDERGKSRIAASKPPKNPNLKYFATPDGQIEYDPATKLSRFVPDVTGNAPAQPIMYSQVVDTDQGKMFATPGKQSLTPAMAPAGAEKPGEPLRGPIKTLDSSEREKLTQLGSTRRDAQRFLDSFKDEYGGYILDAVGNMSNAAGKTFGDDTGQAQFWQDYQTFLNVERNDLFGSALTPSERVEFHKAIISPGMNPDEIRKNLTRQVELVNEVTKRKYASYKSDPRYSHQEIGTLLGLVTVDKKPPVTAAPPGQEPVKNWSEDWNKEEKAKTSKYKEGDKKVNKDGDKLIYTGGRWVEDTE